MKTAVQLLLPEMDEITGFYEARTDRVLVRLARRQPGPPGEPGRGRPRPKYVVTKASSRRASAGAST